MGLLDSLLSLRPDLARAAQSVVDAWLPGEDDDYGGGGVCDDVARAMEGVIYDNLPGVTIVDGGHDGDDRAWIIVYDGLEAFGVDIPPGAYETGGGYSWEKIPDAIIRPEDVSLFKLRRDDVVPDSDTLTASTISSTQEEEDQEWAYQVTFLRNLDSISNDGLVPGVGGGIGIGAYSAWSRGKVFFGGPGSLSYWFNKLELHAQDRSDDPLDDGFVPVVLRFPIPDDVEHDDVAAKESISAEESYYVTDPVNPDEMEVWDGSSWIPVSDWGSIDGSLSFDVDVDVDDETGEESEYRYFKDPNPLLPLV
jgi:hypothetical protein